MKTYIIYDQQNELYYTGQNYPEQWSEDKGHAYEFFYKVDAKFILSSDQIPPGVYEILRVKNN